MTTPHPPTHADWSLGSAEPTAQPASPSRGEGEHPITWQGSSPLPRTGRGAGGEGILDLLRQGLQLARAPRALRWRLETFGLYMPSLPDTRPWWRVNRRALTAFVGQLPRYAHWLTTMRALRHDGAAGYWRVEAATSLRAWEEWLNLSNQ